MKRVQIALEFPNGKIACFIVFIFFSQEDVVNDDSIYQEMWRLIFVWSTGQRSRLIVATRGPQSQTLNVLNYRNHSHMSEVCLYVCFMSRWQRCFEIKYSCNNVEASIIREIL